ncbi:hypothetical protein PG985_000096 [Apiospora marii]|uniref:uncharacterized protein n=1 Tax=Apiospora marii TaxID=335849 RepID=UPI003130C2EA
MSSGVSYDRPALGQDYDLGAIYNAYKDIFHDNNLIQGQPPPVAIGYEKHNALVVHTSPSATLEEKFGSFEVCNELAASFIADAVPTSGSAKYLSQPLPPEGTIEGYVFTEVITESVSLNLDCPSLRNHIMMKALENSANTHVVERITFGVQIIMCAQQTSSGANVTEEHMTEKLDVIKSILENSYRSSSRAGDMESPVKLEDDPNQHGLNNMIFTVFSDFATVPKLSHAKYSTIEQLIPNIPSMLERTNHGRGIPITYHLVPLDDLRKLYGMQLERGISMRQTPDWVLAKLLLIWEKWGDLERKIKQCIREIGAIDFMLTGTSTQRLAQTVMHLKEALSAKDNLQVDFGSVLVKLRFNLCLADSLDRLLEAHCQCSYSPDRVSEILARASDEVSLRRILATNGGYYLNYEDAQDAISAGGDIYVMFFTDQMRDDNTSWQESQSVITKLLSRNPASYIVVVAECEASEIPFASPRISFYSRGEVMIPNMMESVDLADQCFMKRAIKSTVDKDKTAPRNSRLVTLPCPCDVSLPQEWTCFHCRRILQYHEKFFYCDCGRTKLDDSTWQCNVESHGKKFVKWNTPELEAKLSSLNSPKEMNILVLGESGVGKSTFINAFYNHMMFDSLDEAMKHEKLDYAIPCSFTIQYVDESQPDGDIVERDVKIGQDDEENDGSFGQSATQSPTVYSVRVEDRVIRLIDTPGIGDTRGEKFDRLNMSKILSTLNQFSSLHGILILVKPNNARLNVTFKYCVQELLTYLHRDAVQNIVWGFTNTRQSNYMPGDTLKPLRHLLSKHESLGLQLTAKRVYCFDSESFRCLATKKQLGYTMTNLNDFRNSWEHSTKQTRALLDHIESLEPHRVKSTLSINRAREVIAEVTQPMADITDTIERTIRMNQERIKELDSAELQGKSLQQLLQFERIEIEVERLDRPRTVCKDPACVELKDVAGSRRPIYKSICHDNCRLKRVEEDVVGHSDMIGCWAFTVTSDELAQRAKEVAADLEQLEKQLAVNEAQLKFQQNPILKKRMINTIQKTKEEIALKEDDVRKNSIAKKNKKVRSNHCRRCKHHWQSHLHIRYSQTEKVVKDIDAQVQEKLDANASDLVLKRSAIKALEKEIADSSTSRKEIQDAAIRFGLYLKKKSIVPYNDAMIAYLEVLIKDEQEQITHARSIGIDSKKNDERLDSLKKNKKRYEERIKILETQMSKSDENGTLLDEEGVDELVQKLFNLKHWGKNLQAMQEMVEWSKASGFREQELRPRIARSRPKQVAQPQTPTPTRVSQAASILSNGVSSAASAVSRINLFRGGRRERTVTTIDSSPIKSPTPSTHQQRIPKRSYSQSQTYPQGENRVLSYSQYQAKKTRRF